MICVRSCVNSDPMLPRTQSHDTVTVVATACRTTMILAALASSCVYLIVCIHVAVVRLISVLISFAPFSLDTRLNLRLFGCETRNCGGREFTRRCHNNNQQQQQRLPSFHDYKVSTPRASLTHIRKQHDKCICTCTHNARDICA